MKGNLSARQIVAVFRHLHQISSGTSGSPTKYVELLEIQPGPGLEAGGKMSPVVSTIRRFLASLLLTLVVMVLLQYPAPAMAEVAVPGPVFDYPQNGQTLGYEGDYLFRVFPMQGVTDYLWGFFQNGVMVWENYRDTGLYSSNEYGIHPCTEAHSRFSPGNVDVWVRALVNGQWSDATIITIHLQETGTVIPCNEVDLRQNGEITVSGNLVEGGMVYLTIPVKNFGNTASPAMHVYTEGLTASGALWRAEGANPTAVVLQPGEAVEITVQHELWAGEVGWWDISGGVFVWNDDSSSYYGPLDANGYEQTSVDFKVDAAPTCQNYSYNGVVLFEHALCSGSKLEYPASTGIINLTDNGWNDRTSSIHVGSGWSVMTYQHISGGGASRCISRSMWDLSLDYFDNSNISMNDQISSIQVFGNGNCTSQQQPELRQAGEIVVSGNLVEGGTVVLDIPVKNFGNAVSPSVHIYVEGLTASGALWRTTSVTPSSRYLVPGQIIVFKVQYQLGHGEVGWWDISKGVHIWNDDSANYYGPLDANGYEQKSVDFYVAAAKVDLRQDGEIGISGELREGGTVILTVPIKNYGNTSSPLIHPYVEGLTASGAVWRTSNSSPMALRVIPTQRVVFTIRYELPVGEDGLWNTSKGVFIWNDDSSSLYGQLPASGYDQNKSFYVDINVKSIDMGFRPNPDGYKFSNYTGTYPRQAADFTVDDMVDVFGEGVCGTYRFGICNLSHPAQAYYEWLNTKMNIGHCLGMTVTSLRFFKELDQPGNYQRNADTTHDLNPNNARNLIARYHILQYLSPAADGIFNALRNTTPKQVLREMYQMMYDGASDPFDLILLNHERTSGHSVLPYAIEDKGNGVFWVIVYDNNFPDERHYVVFNTRANTWSYRSYSWLAHDVGVVPLSIYLQKPSCPVCSSSANRDQPSLTQETVHSQISLEGEARSLITDSLERRIGFVDQKFINEIPDAFANTNIGGLGIPMEPSYFVPDTGAYTIQLQGLSNDQSDGVSLSYFGHGKVVSADNLSLDASSRDKLAISPNGSEIVYTASSRQEADLTIMAEETSSWLFQFRGIDIGSGESVLMKRDEDAEQLILNYEQASNGVYTLLLEEINDNGTFRFLHSDLAIGAGDTSIFYVGSWTSSDSVTVCTDFGSNGTIDDCVDIENEARQIYLPGIFVH